MTEHGESVYAHLRRLIVEGVAPDAATETVMADLPRRWKDFARPFVYRAARGLEGVVVNRVARDAFGVPGNRRAAAIERLRTTVYRLPDGTRVLWDDMDVTMLELKIAQLRKQVGTLVEHLRVLEAARKLCADRGVARLGDIPDWVQQVRDRVVASGGVAPDTGVTAREAPTSDDVRPGDGSTAESHSDGGE